VNLLKPRHARDGVRYERVIHKLAVGGFDGPIKCERVVDSACQNVWKRMNTLDTRSDVSPKLPYDNVEPIPADLILSEDCRYWIVRFKVLSHVPSECGRGPLIVKGSVELSIGERSKARSRQLKLASTMDSGDR